MKIGILGGSRFIGPNLIENLLKENHQIYIFNRGITPLQEKFPSQVKLFKGNRNKPKTLSKFFEEKYDAVVDLSGFAPFHIKPILNSYSEKIGHYIFCSTISVYKTPPEKNFTESAPKKLGKGNYGNDKFQSEKLLLDFSKKTGLPITILRPPRIFGKYDPGTQMQHIFSRLKHNLPIYLNSKKDNLFTPIYVKDLAKAISLSIQNKKTFGKVYNLASEESLSQEELVRACSIASVIKPDVKTFDKSFPKKVGIPWYNYSIVPNTSKIKKDLKIKFTPLNQALKETYLWLEKNPKHLKPIFTPGEKFISQGKQVPLSEAFRIISHNIYGKSKTVLNETLRKNYSLARFIKILRNN